MPDTSYFVHLKSLTDFARELETQLDGMLKPMDQLTESAGQPVLLGDFGEATSLSESNRAAIEEMHGLLGQVKQAIAFAENVTKTVAEGYQRTDEDVAAALNWSGGYDVTPSTSAVAAIGIPFGIGDDALTGGEDTQV
ncbi:hypothetical protein F0L68_01595 [Solihabitans fulvus]|uniref:Uncharacterized protein n=1 Tax=Solihabitans fulvus TaxID=1892852 RepID=A0A5B2XR94_9PSEU|nr:hypothetical protein [Solihabitans fulvus]KAA2266468.1 hypothetical protein F0L68_01595 [Solihabitans fulvus]